MQRLIDLSMKLNSSFPVRDVVCDSNNQYRYKDESGNDRTDNYLISYVIDYKHMFFHISIAVNYLCDDFIGEFDNIFYKANAHIANVKSAILEKGELHFTGKVFIITSAKLDGCENLVELFKQKHISLNIYNFTDDDLELVSPEVIYIPAHNFEREVMSGDKTLLFSSADYNIFKDDSGEVTYMYHAKIFGSGTSNVDRLNDLSLLSPEKDEFKSLITTKKLKEKHSIVYATALRDTFEGHLDVAKKSLKMAADSIYKSNVVTNVIIALSLYALALFAFCLLRNEVSNLMNGLGNVLTFSVLGGAFSLFSTFSYFKQSGTHTKVELLADLVVKILVSAVSGMLVFFIVKSNLAFGFVNAGSVHLLYILAFLSGWSEKLIVNLLSSLESKFAAGSNITKS